MRSQLDGALNSSVRTAEQTQTVDFWAANSGSVTPPGMWNQIANNVATQQGNSLEDNVRMFACSNAALADAGIAALGLQIHDGQWRPETAIANGGLDCNDANRCDRWLAAVYDHTESPIDS